MQNYMAMRTLFYTTKLWNLHSCIKLNAYKKDTGEFVSDPEWHYTTE